MGHAMIKIAAKPSSVSSQLLERYFHGERDHKTLHLLSLSHGDK
jgi:uncharacterized protein (DUF1810 family)